MYGDYYNNTGMDGHTKRNIVETESSFIDIYISDYILTQTPRDVKVKVMKMLVKIKI